jgi:urease accessory protein
MGHPLGDRRPDRDVSMQAPPARRVWDGHIKVAVQADGVGGCSYTTLHSSGALAVRATLDGVWMVGASAHPLGGDHLRVELDVGPDAVLAMRSASATLARASTPPVASQTEITAEVAHGATLCWSPAPGIAARGSQHMCAARISLHPTSALTWSDAVVLGRMGEEYGSWSSRIRVEVGGRPLLVSDLALGPRFGSWSSSAVLNGARCAQSVILVQPGHRAPDPITHLTAGLLVPLAAGAVQLMSWGDSLTETGGVLRQLICDPLLAAWRDLVPTDALGNPAQSSGVPRPRL